MNNWFDKWGRTSVANIKTDNVVSQTQACLSLYGALIKKMLLNVENPTWNNTYHVLEVAISGVESFESAIDFSKDIGNLSANSEEFREAKEKIRSFFNHIYFNRKIALRLHDLKRTAKISVYRKDILERTIASYAESFYSQKNKKQIQKINMHLQHYELEFLENMRSARKNFHVTFTNIKGIEKLPKHMKQAGKIKAKELKMKGYAFNLQSENYYSLMTLCTDRDMRRVIFQSYVNLASNNNINNDETLKNLIHWRNQKAKLAGFKNYADYAASNAGLDSADTISLFLDNMKTHFEPNMKEHSELTKQYAKDYHGLSSIFAWDRHFVKDNMNKHLYKKYHLKGIGIPFEEAKKSMFDIAHQMFGISFTPEVHYESWHPDAVCYRVTNNKGELISHLVLDIFQRPNKPTGLIYQYTINPTLKVGRNTMPSQQAIVMHLQKIDGNVTLNLDDTVTLFHEFGHALHLLLTKKQHHQHHPFAIEYDAIEFPSQWFERFAKDPKVLGKIAYQKGKAIGEDKAQILVHVEDFNKPQQYWNHILHSKVDIHLNSRFKPYGVKSFHDALSPIFTEYDQVLQKYNKFQNNQFEHFYMGATYYGYLWAEHMIQLWEEKHGEKSLSEQGSILVKLLNAATEKPFNQQFKKMVGDPHNANLNFDLNAPKIKELLNY
jgi:Zn-dependent oligopeptidase